MMRSGAAPPRAPRRSCVLRTVFTRCGRNDTPSLATVAIACASCMRRERVVALADARGDACRRGTTCDAPRGNCSPAKRVRFHSRDGSTPVSSPSMSMPVFAPEAELAEEARGVVDVGVAREHVVVGVAGHDDRLVHVDRAVAAGLVVAEAVRLARGSGRSPGRWIDCGGVRLPDVQRRERQERLDRRARRIGAAQRPVEQRLVRRLVEQLPVRGVDAVDEQVRIVARAWTTKARMSPVVGSIATSAPRCSPKASSATCCSLMSSDRRRLLPETGGVRDSVRTARPPASTSTSSTPVVPCSSRS